MADEEDAEGVVLTDEDMAEAIALWRKSKTTRSLRVVGKVVHLHNKAGNNHTIDVNVPQGPQWEKAKDGEPRKSLANARLALTLYGVKFGMNEMTGYELYLNEAEVWEILTDDMVLEIRQKLLDEFGFDVGKIPLDDAIRLKCLENRFNPVMDWLNGLVWDGVPRLDAWLATYVGAEDSPLNAAIVNGCQNPRIDGAATW
jgi:hypothetical protein